MKIVESFFWGVLAALGSLILEVAAVEIVSGEEKNFFLYVFLFPLIEETFKFFFIFRQAASFSGGFLFFAGAFALGAGFAATEIFFIRLDYFAPDANFLRGSASILSVHLLAALAIGYGVKTFYPSLAKALFFGGLAAILIHGAYNAFIFFQN